ncbi:MAG: hypothetical protein J0M07_07930 [Anaerolineae bacterium]|nr:hypothetical protein [Anaerolineae bacterium]
MSVASYFQAIPKAEVLIQFEGALPKASLVGLADRNDIAETLKHFNDWIKLLDQPDPKRMQDIFKVTSTWFLHGEDLTRAAYDLGTWLAKQNVRYAEIMVNPTFYVELPSQIETFFAALNDGRDRAKRAWGIDIAWILSAPREDSRRADDYARWVSTAVAKRAGVIALALSGREDVAALPSFERAFRAVEKKDIPRVVRAGELAGAEGVRQAVEQLVPNRVVDGWGVADSPEALNDFRDQGITLAVSPSRALKQGWITALSDYPLRRLYDENVSLVVGSDLPLIYKSTLADELTALVDQLGFTVEEAEDIALNGVRASFLPEDAKSELLAHVTDELAALRAEHLEPQAK